MAAAALGRMRAQPRLCVWYLARFH